MSRTKKEENRAVRNRLYTSILLVLLAFAAITAATVAWFSIADKTKVKSMSLDIESDVDLRMDLDAHDYFEQYVKETARAVSFSGILDTISFFRQQGNRKVEGYLSCSSV